MSGKEFPPNMFHPKHTVDRTVEQDEFHKLLQFTDAARLLAIRDKQGTGKSTLLRRLQYNCQWNITPRMPANLIQLEEPTVNTPFILIEKIRKGSFKTLPFKHFDECNKMRLTKNFALFTGPAPAYSGAVYAQGANLGGTNNLVSGQTVTTPQAQNMTINLGNGTGDWGLEQEEFAREECIKAFFADLKALGDQQPLVILLDSYERCDPDLQQWLLNDLLWPLCLDVPIRPAKVILVIAGRELPDFSLHDQRVRSRESLAMWEEDHVNDFLRLHGYDDLDDDDVDLVWDAIRRGKSIATALKMADLLRER